VAFVGDGGFSMLMGPLTLPPDISVDQVVKFTEALAKGQPKRMKIATTATEEALREII
jgi:pyruvate dehydrogenase (quinone)